FLNLNFKKTLDWLNGLYTLVDLAGQNNLFEKYEVIPNQKGEFKKSSDLRAEAPESKIEPRMVSILRALSPGDNLFEKLVHRRVIFSNYTLEQLSLKEFVNRRINELLVEKNENGDYVVLCNQKGKNI